MNFSYVDTELIFKALSFYKENGFIMLSVPLLVDNDILNKTCPVGRENLHENHGDLGYVASAEQSMQYLLKEDRLFSNEKYMALTPCVRNEEVYDILHLKVFLKLELFIPDNTEGYYLASLARNFFNSQKIDCEIINTGEDQYDIIDSINYVELGSYGHRMIQFDDKKLLYSYGTGVAEPRTSYVKSWNSNDT